MSITIERNPPLPLLDMAAYAELCGRLFEKFQYVAILGKNNEDYQSAKQEDSCPVTQQQLAQAYETIDHNETEIGVSFEFSAVDGNSAPVQFRVFARCIRSYEDKHLGTLFVITDERRQRQDTEHLLHLDLLHSIVTKDCRLNLELDFITEELTDRYEELNLIYGTDDNSEHFDQINSVLEDLVLQCSDRMEVAATVLYLHAQNICIIQEPRIPNSAQASISTHIKTTLMPWTERVGSTFVINAPEEAEAECSGIGRKLICSPITGSNGSICGFVAVFNDYERLDFSNSDRNLVQILARKASRVVRSNFDELTGLTNKDSFEFLLEKATRKVQPSVEEVGTLLLIELRAVDAINDTCGNQAGDTLITTVVRMLSDQIESSWHLSRVDSNVFALFMPDIAIAKADITAQKIMHGINAIEYRWDDQEFQIYANMSLINVKADLDAQAQLANAKLVLQAASDKGNNVLEIQRSENDNVSVRRHRVRMLNTINDALKYDRFELFAQGIYSTASRERPHHYELLLRYRDPEGKIHAPFQFIEAAEYYKVMPDIDRWVIHHALTQLGEQWQHIENSGIGWALNLSGQTFAQDGLLDYISTELSASAVRNCDVAFEVTETVAIKNLSSARDTIEHIKQLGCEFYLDDFGTGLSSFTYLMELPFDHVKIDGSFVKKVVSDDVSRAMVKAIADVAATLGMKTVAEFVENSETADALQVLGIDFLQGYGLHEPQPVAEVIAEIARLQRASA